MRGEFVKPSLVFLVVVAITFCPSFALTSTTTKPTFVSCNICGTHGLISNPQVVVVVTGVGKVSCGNILSKTIRSSTCASLQSNQTIQTACGCQVSVAGGDNCNTAASIKVGQTILGSTVGATPYSEFCQSHTVTPDVWYRFVGIGGLVTIDTCKGAEITTLIDVMNGTCNVQICFPYYQSRCPNNDNGAVVSFFSILNQVYYILIWGEPNFVNAGSYVLTLSKREQPLPTAPPTPAPNCYLCGSKQKFVTQPDTLVTLPSVGTVSCGQLQDLASQSLLSRTTCHSLNANITLQKFCGCQAFEPPHTCQNAPLITLGKVVYGSTVGAMIGPGNTDCVLPYDSPGSWYRFQGIGAMVTADTCRFSSITMTVYAFTGTCAALSCSSYEEYYCLNSNPATWFAEKGREYLIFVTYQDTGYFALEFNRSKILAPTP